MKKFFSLLILMSLLSGCGMADRNNVMNLLSAPRLSDREAAIVTAINDYLGTDILLKYPKKGENLSPVQFYDIDGDDRDEAVVLYSDTATSRFAALAVLTQTPQGWQVSFDSPGHGPEIYKISFERITAKNWREIVVSYTFANTEDKILSVYTVKDGGLTEEKNFSCQNYAIEDVTGDNIGDIVLAGVNAENRSTQLKVISTHYSPDYLTTLVSSRLNVKNTNITNIAFSKSMLGAEKNILIDYHDSYNRVYTEAMIFNGSGFTSTLKLDVVQKFWLFDYDLISRDIDDDGYWETPTIIDDGTGTKHNMKYMEWTCFLTEKPERKYYGVCEAFSGVFFPLPDPWQGLTKLNYNEDDKSWQVMRLSDGRLLADFKPVTAYDRETKPEDRITVGKGTVQIIITFGDIVTGDQRRYIAEGFMDIKG